MDRKSAVIHRVGWIRATSRFPGKPQRAALEAAKCHAIYSSMDDETLEDIYRHLREGNHLYVLGVHRLGSTRAELEATLRHCREVGVVVHDLETGGIVDLACYEAAVAAIGVINGEVRMAGPELARRRRTARGGRKVKQGAMPKADAERVWRSADLARTDAEAATITGVGLRTLYRWFGASGRKAGWPKRK